MVTLLISDLILGMHSTMIAVYACMIFTVFLGIRMRKNMSALSIFSTTLVSSLVFYVVTNFAVWATGMVGYPMNFSGLMESYWFAIPFFKWELLGNMFYVSILFGAYSLVKTKVKILA